MLEELLRDNNQSQFHLVKLIEAGSSNGGSGSMSSRASAAAASGSAASSSSTPALQLQSSMSLGGVITFRWTFQCHSYGSALDQCTFLRAQMYLPLHEMIKVRTMRCVVAWIAAATTRAKERKAHTLCVCLFAALCRFSAFSWSARSARISC
jgi:hypothetical protein